MTREEELSANVVELEKQLLNAHRELASIRKAKAIAIAKASADKITGLAMTGTKKSLRGIGKSVGHVTNVAHGISCVANAATNELKGGYSSVVG